MYDVAYDPSKMIMKSFFISWSAIFASLVFSYFISKNIKPGKIRLISLLPIVLLFTLIPLNLFPSPNICGISAFFITWLANFKLLLFAFDKGPLSSPSLSLVQFISAASLPIKIKKPHDSQMGTLKSPLNYAIKFVLLTIVIRVCEYRSSIHHNLLLTIYCLFIYLNTEILLAMFATPARVLLKIEIEPQFDEPYLSTSLQDFWGRRWNLMVSSILRSSVYEPVRSIAGLVVGKRWGSACAMLASFVVSALMHELIYFYLTRVEPTWEVSWFFVLHGVCTALEVLVKKSEFGEKWRLNRLVSGVLTIGFVMGTSFWLFFPQLVRNKADLRGLEEYRIVSQWLNDQVVRLI
ncbi:hypothetical protein Syun_009773 [Stephania yunnanensis]|uniref:Wax synthase domain-containing protein n=1 Tax=Stephania yunnanensis TaxID=152371 RepID=A0AAP0PQZ7_9MAGN